MKKNLANADRIVRILLAIVFTALYLMEMVTGIWGIVLLLLAGIFLVTALINFCPLYRLFGFSTRKSEE